MSIARFIKVHDDSNRAYSLVGHPLNLDAKCGTWKIVYMDRNQGIANCHTTVFCAIFFCLFTLAVLPALELAAQGNLLRQVSKPKNDAENARSLAILRFHDIEPSLEGLSSFLKSIQPDHPDQSRRIERAREWIALLGHEEYKVREKSHRALVRMPRLPEPEVLAAAKSADPEVASRANMILRQIKNRQRRDTLSGIVEAICKTIMHRRLAGLTSELLATIPQFNDQYAINAIRGALAATARAEDVDQLRRAMASENRDVRVAAIEALVEVLGAESRDDLNTHVKDTDSHVRLSVARSMANLGFRESLPVLIELMNADGLEIRLVSNKTLRSLTGQRFQFFAYETEKSRQAAVKKWSDWLESEGATAELSFPLVDVKLELGRVLISDYQTNQVVEVNEKGEETWKIEISHPWGVQGTSNGHRVIATYQPSAIVEYDAKGNEVWRKDNVPGNAMGIDRLDNGHTLVACSSVNRVIEYRRDGTIAWEATVDGRPCDVQRLENGNTLIALIMADKVVEVDQSGEIVWQISVAKPLTAQRLENGNTLVSASNSNVAIEFDRKGQKAREIDLGVKCSAARQLSNGDTLVANDKFVRLVSPDGSTRWEVKGLTYCYGIMPY